MQVAVRVWNEGDFISLLADDEQRELLETGALRLEFPKAVLRWSVVSGVILQVLFEM